ncbi:hypothetical protein [Afifella sp. IM 167]|uniref:WYL domain-containing protein n=1 Tax=Afifella sp. IM 167 TaxID=2033586 RepID=UPI001CCC21EB|nr:hypothetical protein [Afifella sp. IM 167]MBZ8133263.1 hypothetical protein [Afifella sp. IM 167]
MFGISYENSSGERSARTIRLKDVYRQEGQIYIVADCSRAGGERTFRADRILRMVEHRSGAEIGNPVRFFSRFVEGELDERADHASVMMRARPGLRALLWIARADRDLSASEESLLVEYVAARAALGKGAQDFDEDLARIWIARERPTLDSASGAVARMARSPGERRLFLEFSERLCGLAEAGAPGGPEGAERKRRERLVRLLS